MKAIIDHFNVRELPVSQRLTALRAMLVTARDREDHALIKLLEESIAADEALFAMEQRWRQRKRHKVRHGARATELDRDLDRLLAGFERALSAQVTLRSFAEDEGAAAERLYEALFPAGLGAITQGSFSDQAHATRLMLRSIDESEGFSALIEEMGLSGSLAMIRELNEEYSAEVSAARPPRREELEAERREGHVRLGQILLRVLIRHPEDSEADREQRAVWLDPLEVELESLRAFYRERARRREPETESSEAA